MIEIFLIGAGTLAGLALWCTLITLLVNRIATRAQRRSMAARERELKYEWRTLEAVKDKVARDRVALNDNAEKWREGVQHTAERIREAQGFDTMISIDGPELPDPPDTRDTVQIPVVQE